MSAPALPAFAGRLCDDAAVFPPGLAALPDAVRAHRRYRAAPFRDLVGPLVLAAPAIPELPPLLSSRSRELDGPLALAITAPEGPRQVAAAQAAAASLPVHITAVEIAVPGAVDEFLDEFDRLDLAGADSAAPTPYVEVSRDERRTDLLAGLARRGVRAKFRTGGVRAELYPDAAELAAAVGDAVAAGVPFKATAGLHHAVRNTDPETGFDQHGFLNLLLAADTALRGGGEADIAEVLEHRDGHAVASSVRALGPERTAQARAAFVSFGTCSIVEPLGELVDLELIPAALAAGEE